jgi:hypothetical protein
MNRSSNISKGKCSCPHASLTVGAVKLGVAGQSIVALAPAAPIVGGVISLTVITCEAVAVLAHASVTVHVLVTV